MLDKPQVNKKWLVNVTENPGTRNATHGTGMSLKHFQLGVSFSLCFYLTEEVKNVFDTN